MELAASAESTANLHAAIKEADSAIGWAQQNRAEVRSLPHPPIHASTRARMCANAGTDHFRSGMVSMVA